MRPFDVNHVGIILLRERLRNEKRKMKWEMAAGIALAALAFILMAVMMAVMS
jgi:hypothetical protein